MYTNSTIQPKRLSRGKRKCARRVLAAIRRSGVNNITGSDRGKLRATVAGAMNAGLWASNIIATQSIPAKPKPHKRKTSTWCHVCCRATNHINGTCARHESVHCAICKKDTIRFNGGDCRNHVRDFCFKCGGYRDFISGICEDQRFHPVEATRRWI